MKNALLLSIFLISSPIWACKCDFNSNPLTLAEYNRKGAVFEGTILRIEILSPENPYKRIVFKVTDPVKNTVKGQEIAIYAQTSDDLCTGLLGNDYNSYIGSTQWINAVYDKTTLAATSCGNLRLFEADTPHPQIGVLNAMSAYGKQTGYVKNYYPNGVLEAEGYLKNGIAEGKWKYYDKNACLEEEVNYKNGFRDGNGIYYGYDESHNLVGYAETEWKLNRQIRSISYNTDGTPNGSREEHNYIKFSENIYLIRDIFESDAITYDENNNIQGKTNDNYINGYLYGEYTQYYLNGTIKERRLYNEKADKVTYYEYDENGVLKNENSHPFKQ